MANQQLKRLLRRAPEMEEAEFELLQSRVLSRLNKTAPAPIEEASTNGAEPEASAASIEASPSTNGAHPDSAPESGAGDTRIRSIKVTTYDVPATAVGVMAEVPSPDWDLAALPMIVRQEPKLVTKVEAVVVADPVETIEPAGVTEQVEAIEEPAVVEDPVEAVQPADVAEPIQPIEAIEPVEPANPTEPAEAVEPAEAIAPAEAVRPADVEAAVTAPVKRAPTKKPSTRRTKVVYKASGPPAFPNGRTIQPPRPAAFPGGSSARPASQAADAVPYCPYCAVRLDPAPTTSKRCARCHERIMVKRVEGRVIYLTEASVAVFEAERRRMTNAGRWTRERDRWLKVAATVGAPAARIARLAAAPISAEVVTSAENLYTTTVEQAFRGARRDRRWEDASRVRREQAQVLFRFAGSPIPPPEAIVKLHREGAAAQLRGIEEMTRQAELVSAGCCDVCKADGGQTFKISLELRTPRLPHEGCSKGLCRCDWYLPVRDQTMVRRQLRRRARVDQALPPRDA